MNIKYKTNQHIIKQTRLLHFVISNLIVQNMSLIVTAEIFSVNQTRYCHKKGWSRNGCWINCYDASDR